MEIVGVTAEQFTATMKADSTDEGVTKRFREEAKPHTPAEMDAWNG